MNVTLAQVDEESRGFLFVDRSPSSVIGCIVRGAAMRQLGEASHEQAAGGDPVVGVLPEPDRLRDHAVPDPLTWFDVTLGTAASSVFGTILVLASIFRGEA